MHALGAVKLLRNGCSEGDRDEFLREAEAMLDMEHPQVGTENLCRSDFFIFFSCRLVVRIAGQRQWFSEVRLAPLAEFPGTRAMVGC